MLLGFKGLAASVEDLEPEPSTWYQNLNKPLALSCG